MAKKRTKWLERLLYIILAITAVYSLGRLISSRQTTLGKGKIIVAAVGDSITYGAGVASSRDTDSYPALLQQAL